MKQFQSDAKEQKFPYLWNRTQPYKYWHIFRRLRHGVSFRMRLSPICIVYDRLTDKSSSTMAVNNVIIINGKTLMKKRKLPLERSHTFDIVITYHPLTKNYLSGC